jgi:hypothetical protein
MRICKIPQPPGIISAQIIKAAILSAGYTGKLG